MKEIPLTQGKVAIVDDRDYERAASYKWCAWSDGKRWHAIRKTKRGDSEQTVYLHRFILGVDNKQFVSFRDGNGLNCTRNNLRRATLADSRHNRGIQKNNTSGFKGVSWYPSREQWRAKIGIRGKIVHLGYFDDIEKAAEAYNQAAIKYHGEFAYQNQPRRSKKKP